MPTVSQARQLIVAALLVASAIGAAPARPDVPATQPWPPPATRPADGTPLSAELFTELHSKKLRLALPPREGWHLVLLSVDYFDGNVFKGTYQRFEEQTGLGRFTIMVPPPEPTERLVVRLQAFEVDEGAAKAKERRNWYAHTWGRFTTAVPLLNGWRWYRSLEPLDRDLGRWLEWSELEAVRAYDATAEVAGQ